MFGLIIALLCASFFMSTATAENWFVSPDWSISGDWGYTFYTVSLTVTAPQATTYTIYEGSSVPIMFYNAGNDTGVDFSWNLLLPVGGWYYSVNQTSTFTSLLVSENFTGTFCVTASGDNGAYDYEEVPFSILLVDMAQTPDIDDGELPTVNNNWLWIFLYQGDFLGFFQAMFLSAFGMVDLVYGVLCLVLLVPLYIRTKSLLLICVLWIMIGGFFIALMPAVSALAILFMILGVGGLLWRIFRGGNN
jgi:hypothetical protein